MLNSKDTIGTLFQDIARLRIFCYDNLLKDIELTATQSWVMFTLFEQEGIIQGDLARSLGIRAVTLGGLVDRIEAKGWLERRPDKKDRRANRIWLTEKGKNLKKIINRCLEDVNDIALEGIPKEEVINLFDSTTAIRKNLLNYKDNQQKN